MKADQASCWVLQDKGLGSVAVMEINVDMQYACSRKTLSQAPSGTGAVIGETKSLGFLWRGMMARWSGQSQSRASRCDFSTQNQGQSSGRQDGFAGTGIEGAVIGHEPRSTG